MSSVNHKNAIESAKLSSKLASLFYAVAVADGNVRLAEIKDLHNALAGNWKTGTDVLNKKIIFNKFYHLQTKKATSHSAFHEFVNYYNQNKERFNAELTTKIIETAASIAAAYSGNNKSELTILAQLHFLLKGP